MSHKTFNTFLEFGEALLEHGISHVVQRETHEIRPRTGDGHSVIVGVVHEASFLAYHQGVVLKCTVAGEALPDAIRWLTDQQIQIKRVSANIG